MAYGGAKSAKSGERKAAKAALINKMKKRNGGCNAKYQSIMA
jgi:hypothetical protein